MFQLVTLLGVRGLAVREAIPIGLSLAIAEFLYKFHSFTLEAAAFLATWLVLDAVWNSVFLDRSKTDVAI